MSDHGHSTPRLDPHVAAALKLEEAEKNPGGLNAPLIGFVGLVGVVLVFVIMIATEAWYYSQQAARNQTGQFREPNLDIESYHAAEAARLRETRWLDYRGDHVSIPIDKALDAYATDEAFRGYAARSVPPAAPAPAAPTTPAAPAETPAATGN